MMMLVGILGASQHLHLCTTAVGRSAHAFSRYFQALGQESLNPIERVVFSLALTNAKARQECRETHPQPLLKKA
ncbi:MAG TPA: hypothetical protein VMU80_12750 [Bryobacteraceae bacterium]|nr:hypothetical protein [Bryobacteraceae bacterium]